MYFDPYVLFSIIVLLIVGIPLVNHNVNVLKTRKKQKAVLQDYEKRIEQKKRELEEEQQRKLYELDRIKAHYEEMFRHTVEEKSQSYPWLAGQIADIEKLQDDEIENELRNKSRPALKAANEVAKLSLERRALKKESKMLQYQLEYLFTVFPWLEDFKEITPDEGYRYVNEITGDEQSEYESLKAWLSPEEYNKLSTAQRYQVALDRYLSRKKTDWDVGIEYERYVGYFYESKGYKVTYNGAIKGLNDMGRDLLVEKDGRIYVVQCKRWASDKTIHEKHIFQLFGTTVSMRLNNPDKKYIGVFITTAKLSELAERCAQELKIQVITDLPYDPGYPKIKCNINAQTKEKIYHLPMDQQYDKIVISGKKGARYVSTVQEAEDLGYRRAYRWHGTGMNNNAVGGS